MNIQRQPGANIIKVVDSIKLRLKQLQANLPASVKVEVLTDRTTTIRASVKDVQFELMLTVVLVVMVIFLFLRTLSATIIPSIAVPLSLVGTFGVMYMLNYSLDNLSLMALTISTGFVVDDAIVMIENISRYIEEGHTPLEAALQGSGQIGFTIVSLTVSLIAVLIPLLFMGDIVGRLFREFAVTLSVTILLSAIISLTLTPMMCALLLRPHNDSHHGWFYEKSENVFNKTIAFYGRTVQFVLKHQTITLLVTIATLVATIWLYIIVPKGFFPVQDTGVIMGISDAPESVSFASMAERQQRLAAAVLKDPDVESLSSFIGVDGTNTTPNSGRIQINLKPKDERTEDASAIIQRLQKEVAGVEGITLYMQPVQDLTVEDRISRTQYQFSLEDADPKELGIWTDKLMTKLKTLPELRDIATDQQNQASHGEPGDRPRHRLAHGHQHVGGRQHTLRRLRPAAGVDHVYAAESVSRGAGSGPVVPQRSGFAEDDFRSGNHWTSAIKRDCALRDHDRTVGHQPSGPVPRGDILVQPGRTVFARRSSKSINAAVAELGLPPSIQVRFQGTARAFEASQANEGWLILAAIVTVYIVLGVLYESYIHPITILSTLPSAGVGAILALTLFRMPLGVMALIGIILLIGIVKKNAIMMIDFALEAERKRVRLRKRRSMKPVCCGSVLS